MTYVFGTVGVLVFLKNIAPAILHVDLKEETKKLAEKLNFTSGSFSPLTSSVRVRGFLLGDDSPIVGKKILQIEKQYHYEFVVEAVLRKEESIPATSDLVLFARRRDRGRGQYGRIFTVGTKSWNNRSFKQTVS
ncbi:hypothetical protein PC847_14535 (plasmid) [Lactiplantibacillus plantarum]|nr:hypothetical protein [Lactiplantibacillus plantarum]WBV39137.1 hypothetical protein PC847_14535 [Lactiplantibacillus plantarum]